MLGVQVPPGAPAKYRFCYLAATPHHHFGKAREALKNLLGKSIVLHPYADGAGRYLTAEVTGDNAGLFRLAIGKNKGGGGQSIQPSLVPLLRFEIQGIALAA